MAGTNDNGGNAWRKTTRVDSPLSVEQLQTLQELSARWLAFADDAYEAILEFEVSAVLDNQDKAIALIARESLRNATLAFAAWLPIPQPIQRRKFE